MLQSQKDFLAFEQIMAQAQERFPLRILSYCLMGNHWHFVVWPEKDGDLTSYFRWLTHTHAMRWRVAHNTVGYGHLYQGRFKSFPVQGGASFLKVCRYVERNALSAELVKNAEDWRWSSLWVRNNGTPEQKALLTPWPIEQPRDWLVRVNEMMTAKEITRWRQSLLRGSPFGDDEWTRQSSIELGLEYTLRDEGRPRSIKTGTQLVKN